MTDWPAVGTADRSRSPSQSPGQIIEAASQVPLRKYMSMTVLQGLWILLIPLDI